MKEQFETAYREYKDYEDFIKKLAPKIKEDREQFQNFINENQSNTDLIAKKMFEINAEPVHYQNDLLNLQIRLIHYYNIIKSEVEIPQEISKEIESFILPNQVYFIKDGEPIEIDPEKNKKFREDVEKEYLKIVKNIAVQ